jgi:hypothetical protein
VEQWAKIRRTHFVERLSIKEIHRRTGRDRKTIRRAIHSAEPPRYRRAPRRRSLIPSATRSTACCACDARLPGKRIRELIEELGYEGGKTILDDFCARCAGASAAVHLSTDALPARRAVALRPVKAARAERGRPRTGAVGFRCDRGAVLVAGARRRAGLLQPGAGPGLRHGPLPRPGWARCPSGSSGDREGVIHAGGGRPTEEFAGFCGQLAVG